MKIDVMSYLNCKRKYSDGNYVLKITGLDAEDERKFEISDITSSLCEQNKYAKNSAFNYEILEVPNEIKLGEVFNSRVRVTNNLNVKQKFELWSELKQNKKKVSINSEREVIELIGGGSAIIKLENQLNTMNEDTKLELKLLPEERKRPYTTSYDIKVIGEVVFSETVLNEEFDEEGNIVYISKSQKQKKLAPYFFGFLMITIIVYLLTIKNDKNEDNK